MITLEEKSEHGHTSLFLFSYLKNFATSGESNFMGFREKQQKQNSKSENQQTKTKQESKNQNVALKYFLCDAFEGFSISFIEQGRRKDGVLCKVHISTLLTVEWTASFVS